MTSSERTIKARRVFVADHLPNAAHVYRYVRHRGLERAAQGLSADDCRRHMKSVGTRENIPASKGRAAALRRAGL